LGTNSTPRWDSITGKVRLIHDWVCLALILGINVVAGVILFSPPHYGVLTDFDKWFSSILFVVVIISLGLVYWIGNIRHQPLPDTKGGSTR
jgi:uncharacterized membrane protein (DUF373 family)